MKKRRLNGWQRLGVIASVLWFLIAGWKANDDDLRGGTIAFTNYESCLDRVRSLPLPGTKPDFIPYIPPGAPTTEAGCEEQNDKEWHELTKYHFLDSAIAGIVPIPFAWLAVYGLIWLVRWVRRGFADSAREVDSEIAGSILVPQKQQ